MHPECKYCDNPIIYTRRDEVGHTFKVDSK